MDNQWHISLPLTTLLTPPFVGPESNYALPSAVDKTMQDFQAKFPCILSPEWADEPRVVEAVQFRICCSKIHKGLERASHRLAAPFHQVLLYKEMSETTLTCQKLSCLQQNPAIDSVKWSKNHAFEWQCQSWPWPAMWKKIVGCPSCKPWKCLLAHCKALICSLFLLRQKTRLEHVQSSRMTSDKPKVEIELEWRQCGDALRTMQGKDHWYFAGL